MRLVERLRAELHGGPAAAALAVWRGSRDGALLDEAAGLACEPTLDTGVRLAALLAIALVAREGVRVPDRAIEALDDDELIDAAIAAGVTPAITGVLAAAGERVDARTRRFVALRLVAGQATGMHVAALLVESGDLVGAARTAAPDLVAATPRGDGDRLVLALAELLARWSEAHAALADHVAAQLPPGPCRVLASAARTLGHGSDHALVVALERRAAS